MFVRWMDPGAWTPPSLGADSGQSPRDAGCSHLPNLGWLGEVGREYRSLGRIPPQNKMFTGLEEQTSNPEEKKGCRVEERKKKNSPEGEFLTDNKWCLFRRDISRSGVKGPQSIM